MKLLILTVLITGNIPAVANPGGSTPPAPAVLSAQLWPVVRTLSASEDVQQMYSNIFAQLEYHGSEFQRILENTLQASPKVVEAVTRRWNRPAETLDYNNYRKIFINDERLRAGKKFHDTHRELVHHIAATYGVDEYILLAIIGVESMYGASHADYRVVDVFHTVAHDIPRKRQWAERELLQFFNFCIDNQLDPGTVWGSYAGAIGYAQFIPSSLNSYGKDNNGDGRVDPYIWEDALESVANYLVQNRYERKSTDFNRDSRNWKSIYTYNHSDNYVKVVIEFRTELKRVIETNRG
ncbi:MAG: lytic murein transglycosylase [Candidatus Neomarinimicrobiota bacterium]